MREEIGTLAGEMWKTLGTKKEVNLAQIPRMTKKRGELAYQALGWLLHEDKIKFQSSDSKILVSLTDKEQFIFNSCGYEEEPEKKIPEKIKKIVKSHKK